MYAFVDRPVESLSNSGRFLLWAMRGWVHAAVKGACPPQALRQGFAVTGALPALPDFHIAMALIRSRASAILALAPMPCPRVSEHEAILLGLWQGIALEDPATAHATLTLLTGCPDTGPAVRAMDATIERLAIAGFDPSALLAGTLKHQESSK
jgi:hypothetical protein